MTTTTHIGNCLYISMNNGGEGSFRKDFSSKHDAWEFAKRVIYRGVMANINCLSVVVYEVCGTADNGELLLKPVWSRDIVCEI